PAHRDEERRVDRGIHHALPDRLELAGVRDIARERRREIARLLARSYGGDVKRRESVRELLQRRRERLALAQHRAQALEDGAKLRAPLLLRERLDRLDQRQAGRAQPAQLLP